VGQGTESLVAGKSACAPIEAEVARTSRFSPAQNMGHKCPSFLKSVVSEHKSCAFFHSRKAIFPQKFWILAPEKSFDVFWEQLSKEHLFLLITTKSYDIVSDRRGITFCFWFY